MKTPIPESYWVQENRFLAGEYPGGFNAASARRRIDAFLEAGINTFIDLTQPHELVPYEPIVSEQARIYEMNAVCHRVPIRDHSIPSRETMVHILNLMDEALNAGRNIYVHCWGGIGRTGTVVGCHLVRHGMSHEVALAEVNRLYKTRPANGFYPNSPETGEQIRFVREWREIPHTAHKSGQKFCEG